MKHCRFLRPLFAVLLFCCCAPAAFSQTAQVTGQVSDPEGAVVPGTKVIAINQGTGLKRETLTNNDGYYTVPLLPPGSYQITVQKDGFKPISRSGITLQVEQVARLDFKLEIGAATETVQITGAAPLLETQAGTLRGVVDQQRMVSLPLNGRNMTQLVNIQAGVIQTADNSANGEGIGFAVNGSRQNGLYYLLDGGYNTSTYRNFSGTFPNPDAVQEFSVQRNNFSAEYANATGAVVNVVTKAGTNEYHGTLFEFVRNGSLNARNFFAPVRDSLKRNQFGGTFGGPVLKDRLFFFGSYQGTRLRSDPQLTRQFLPTAAQRAGDFSSSSQPIIDPLTNEEFPGNQIPVSRFSPAAVNLLKYIPVPAAADGQRFVGSPIITDTNEYTGRVDYNLRSHRFSGKAFVQTLSRPFFAEPNDIAYPLVTRESQPYRHFSGNHLYTFSSTLINSATIARRYRARFDDWDGFEYPINFQTAGVKNIAINQPAGMIVNVSGFFNISTAWPYEIEDGDWHFSDTLTWVRGQHEFKFGGEFIRSTNEIRNHFRTMGQYTFDGNVTGNAMADFLLGGAYNFLQGGGEYKDLTGNRLGFFAQDNWRVRPSLTLNLGLRHDPALPFKDSLGRVQCFRPGEASQRFPKAPLGYLSAGDPGCPEGGFDPYYRSFAPRFGFAWRPFAGKTVVRGGFGLFWTPQFTVQYNGFVNGAPFSPQVNRFGVSLDDPYENTVNPFPASYAPFTPTQNAEFLTTIGLMGSFAPNFRPSYTEAFNFTMEREVVHNTLARASYVGNLGRRLPYDNEINYARYVLGNSTTDNIQDRRPHADYGQILEAVSEGTSSYHALQLSVERRFEKISFEASYTWSKAIDEYSTDPTPGMTASLSVPYSRRLNRGMADFDVKHRFVASYVWTLPALKQQHPVVRAVFGNWETSGIWSMQSGRPFMVLSGRDNSRSGIGRDRADLVGDPYLDAGRSREERIAQYFNPAAYTTNAVGTFGTAPRNHLRGPGYFNTDLAAMKTFSIRENLRMQFRAEFFNAFNQPNFNAPFAIQSTTGRFGHIETAGDPRIIQLSIKVLF
jgi:outer membrane receptor protein involved in Fe transport